MDKKHGGLMFKRVWTMALITGIAVLLTSTSADVRSQTRQVSIVVPYSAGVGTDILARLVAEQLQERIGQPVVVENRPGASGNIGTQYVARAAPDGHTLLITTPSHVLANIGPFKKFPFDPLTSFAPIIKAATGTFVFVVGNNFSAKSLREYIALARSRPGELNYASPGALTAQYFGMELLKLATGINIVHVPYTGAAGAVQDVVGGHVSATFIPLAVALPLVANHKIRALAVASEKRSTLLPDVPTLSEEGVKGAELHLFYGILAPAGTPADVVERYNKLVNEILLLAKISDVLTKQGFAVAGGTAADFAHFLTGEIHRWEKVIVDAKLTPR